MATIGYYTMDKDEFELNLSKAMEVSIGALVAEGLMSSEQAQAFLSTHSITIATKKNAWYRWFKSFQTEDEEVHGRMIVVKTHSKLIEPTPEKQKDANGENKVLYLARSQQPEAEPE